MTAQLTRWVQEHYGLEVMRPGLDRMRTVLSPLLPKLQQKKIVTIAGTNGKGETTFRLSNYLKDVPHCAWTSPHVSSLCERFSSNQGMISEHELERLIQRCHQKVNGGPVALSFYEFLFYVFCTWATEVESEVILLEVGLGGRLDAVNVLDANLVLLPSISRDHQEFLGHRYDQILKEKLGVVRRNATLLSFFDLSYLRERTQSELQAIGGHYLDLSSVSTLKGHEFSARNQFLAYAAFSFLQIGAIEDLAHQLIRAKWSPSEQALPNRGEVFRGKSEFHFYGSHNPDGMRKLIQFSLSDHYNFTNPQYDLVLTSFSRRNENDVTAMLRMLKHFGASKLKVCTFPHAKSFSSERLEEMAIQEGLEFVKDLEPYLQKSAGQKVLVVGSYYFLGHVRGLLGS